MKPNDLNELKQLSEKRLFVDTIVDKIKTRFKLRTYLKTALVSGLVSGLVCGLITLALPASLMFIGLTGVGLSCGVAAGCGIARACLPSKDDKEKDILLKNFPEEAKVLEGAENNLEFDINARDCARYISSELNKKINKLKRNIPYGKLQDESNFKYNDKFRTKTKSDKQIYANVEMPSCKGRTVEQNNVPYKIDEEKDDMDR